MMIFPTEMKWKNNFVRCRRTHQTHQHFARVEYYRWNANLVSRFVERSSALVDDHKIRFLKWTHRYPPKGKRNPRLEKSGRNIENAAKKSFLLRRRKIGIVETDETDVIAMIAIGSGKSVLRNHLERTVDANGKRGDAVTLHQKAILPDRRPKTAILPPKVIGNVDQVKNRMLC